MGRDGTLHVNTLDSIWAFELTNRAAEIAARLQVDAIRFSPGPLPEAPPTEDFESPPPLVRPPRAVEEEGERIAAAIEDENLRKIVARAAAASLAKGLSDRSV